MSEGFPGGSVGKNPPSNSRDAGSIPGSGSSPGEGNGNPLQYSCPRNPTDSETWKATVHEVAEMDMTEHAQAQFTFPEGPQEMSTSTRKKGVPKSKKCSHQENVKPVEESRPESP